MIQYHLTKTLFFTRKKRKRIEYDKKRGKHLEERDQAVQVNLINKEENMNENHHREFDFIQGPQLKQIKSKKVMS